MSHRFKSWFPITLRKISSLLYKACEHIGHPDSGIKIELFWTCLLSNKLLVSGDITVVSPPVDPQAATSFVRGRRQTASSWFSLGRSTGSTWGSWGYSAMCSKGQTIVPCNACFLAFRDMKKTLELGSNPHNYVWLYKHDMPHTMVDGASFVRAKTDSLYTPEQFSYACADVQGIFDSEPLYIINH